jgi:hypothetical protein
MIHRGHCRVPRTLKQRRRSSLCSNLFLPAVNRRSFCGPAFQPLRIAFPAAHAGTTVELHPLFRIDALRPVLFSGEALPILSLRRVQRESRMKLPGEIYWLSGELALPG